MSDVKMPDLLPCPLCGKKMEKGLGQHAVHAFDDENERCLLRYIGINEDDYAAWNSRIPVTQVDDGYIEAFYKIADILQIGAKPYSPKIAFERDVLPKLRNLMVMQKWLTHVREIADE